MGPLKGHMGCKVEMRKGGAVRNRPLPVMLMGQIRGGYQKAIKSFA